MYDIIIDDEKMINLITTFGDPFPKAGNILALKLYDEEKNTSDKASPSDPTINHHGRTSQANGNIGDGYENGESGGDIMREKDIIKVHLEPHEGQKANPTSPFNILPKQTVSK